MKNLHINKVWLSGTVRTHPQIRQLSEKTKLTSFSLSVLETWESRGGETKSHRNDIQIEVLGKEAQAAYDTLSPGKWVSVDGYLRSEQFKGRLQIKVRVFNIVYEGEYDGYEEDTRPGEEVSEKVRFTRRDKSS
jgi:single-stranded DNA-binding protein